MKDELIEAVERCARAIELATFAIEHIANVLNEVICNEEE